jgi:hypothetical protein
VYTDPNTRQKQGKEIKLRVQLAISLAQTLLLRNRGAFLFDNARAGGF